MFGETVGSKLSPFDDTMSSKADSAGGNGANHPGATPDKSGSNGPDIASQADLLLELIDELKSITDRACNAAVRESECAEQIEESKGSEVATLLIRLKETEDALAARDAVVREREEITGAKIQDLETQLREKQTQLEAREIEVENLKTNLRAETTHLHDAESQAQEAIRQLRAEMAGLARQLQETQTELEAKDHQLTNADGEVKAKNQDLEVRLQERESQLQSCQAELKEKENLIQGAASREMEIGKLIARLSGECGKLSAELNEKSLIVAQLEKKQRYFTSDGPVWKKVLGRGKDEAV